MNVDIAILGAGISGLSFAYFLERTCPALSSVIIEPQERCGGWIQTVQLPSGQLYETGPRCLRLRGEAGAATADLLYELGLEHEVIPSSRLINRRYVVFGGSPQLLPHSLKSLVVSPIGRHLLKTALCEPFRRQTKSADESVASFFSRRCRSPIVDVLADALVSGIWGGDPSQLSIRATFPELAAGEDTYGSCLLGGMMSLFAHKEKPRLSGIYTLKNGLTQLVSTLFKSLRSPVLLSTSVTSIDQGTSPIVLHTSQGQVTTKLLVCALPDTELFSLFPSPPFGRTDSVPHASFATVVVGWEKDLLNHKGFGVLAPSTEDSHVLGIVCDSCVFPLLSSNMKTRLTVILGGARWPQVLNQTDDDLLTLALDRTKKWLGISDAPNESAVFRAPFSIPQPPVGIGPPVPFYESSCHTIFALNSSIGGVSMNQCIFSAKQLTKHLQRKWEKN